MTNDPNDLDGLEFWKTKNQNRLCLLRENIIIAAANTSDELAELMQVFIDSKLEDAKQNFMRKYKVEVRPKENNG